MDLIMANFAVAASNDTIDRANKIMELYAQPGDKKEDTLIRILEIAESESVRGTHPELEHNLRAIDTTITTLIKQINGIVAGQDYQIAQLHEQLEAAFAEKQNAIESASRQIDEARSKSEEAEMAMQQASIDIDAAYAKAKSDIEEIEAEKNAAIEKFCTERDQAIRERDDARTIAAEKTALNSLLSHQVSELNEELVDFKNLQNSYKSLETNYASLQKQLETVQMQEELNIERAVIAKERELRDEFQQHIREADKENARLSYEISQLKVEFQKFHINQ